MPNVTLNALAYARSGDKGDVCNIGLMARTPDIYEFLRAAITEARVKQHFGVMVRGEVTIYPMDNIHSLAIVLRGALGGGATTTLRYDQTGKAMGSALLRLEVDAPQSLIEQGRAQEALLRRGLEDA
jgi:hypothetical protein